jgi:CRISPR system Cascade subunit CasC
MPPKFLQIHFLTSYPATLLNRDDAGFAKRMPFGGATRLRVSSQCLKRHWRTHDGKHSLGNLGVDMSIRSRRTFEEFVYDPLVDAGHDEEIAADVTSDLKDAVLGARAGGGGEEGRERLRSNQVTVLGRPEVEYLREIGESVCEAVDAGEEYDEALKEVFDRDAKANLKALDKAAGLDAALFGRMVTSDILARGDAAVHVAHAMTVHEEDSESDYFTAVDDLVQEAEETGSGHINSTELTSGLFYGYLVVDVPLLVSNLEGCRREDWVDADRSLAGDVVGSLVHLAAKVSPGAKLGSTAPYAYAHLMLVEAGDTQPRTLANAFMEPVSKRPDLVANAYRALGEYLGDVDDVYGRETMRRAAAVADPEPLVPAVTEEELGALDQVAGWVRSKVQG